VTIVNLSYMDSVDLVLENATRTLLAEVTQQLKQLGETEVPQDDVWFRNLLFALLKSAIIDFQSVQRGATEYVPLAAWGRRNLLEDKVITEFVLESEENARSFQTDLSIDAKELNEAFTKHHIATHKQMLAELTANAQTLSGPEREAVEQYIKTQTAKGPDTSGTDFEADMFRQLLTEMRVEEKRRPMMTSGKHGFADRIGQMEEFSPMFKICSKLMHRTTLSISAENTIRGLDAIIPILKDSALGDLVVISNRIKEHVATVGLHPVTPE
jgi:hypothetical protein